MKKLSMQLLADTVVSRRKAMKITQAQLSKTTGINRGLLLNIPVAEYRQSGKMETANPAFWKPAFRRNGNRCPAGACVRC